MKKIVLLLIIFVFLVSCTQNTGQKITAEAINEQQIQHYTVTNHQVNIEDFAFKPTDLEINKDDSVTWTQKDGVKHTATSVNGPESFDSGLLAKGQSFTYTFTKPGVYEYICTPHPRMRGKIVVK